MFACAPYAELPMASTPGFVLGVSVISEGAGASDQIIGLTSFNTSISDSSVVSEGIFPVGEYAQFVSERVGAVDPREIGGGYAFGGYASGSYSGLGDNTRRVPSDSISTTVVVNSNAFETGVINDSVPMQLFMYMSIDTSAGVSGQPIAPMSWSTLIAQTVTASDVNSAIRTMPVLVSESVAGVETGNTQAVLGATSQNSTQATVSIPTNGVLNIGVQETTVMRGTVPTNVVVNASTLYTTSIGGVLGVIKTMPVSVVEGASVFQDRDIGGGYTFGGFASGGYSGLGDEVRRVSGESFTAYQTHATAVIDSAVPSMLTLAQHTTNSIISETVVPVDRIPTNGNLNASIVESVVNIDRPYAQTTVYSYLAQSASYSDNITMRLQWELVNTKPSETVDWTLVNTSI